MKKHIVQLKNWILILVALLSFGGLSKDVKAASGTASLDSLGKLGTVNVGSKSESGIWLQTLVNEKPVFCMDLGKACHTGYTYKSESKTNGYCNGGWLESWKPIGSSKQWYTK